MGLPTTDRPPGTPGGRPVFAHPPGAGSKTAPPGYVPLSAGGGLVPDYSSRRTADAPRFDEHGGRLIGYNKETGEPFYAPPGLELRSSVLY